MLLSHSNRVTYTKKINKLLLLLYICTLCYGNMATQKNVLLCYFDLKVNTGLTYYKTL